MEFDLSQIKLSHNDVKRGLVLPKTPSEELAEFIGILTGDGFINYYANKKIYITDIAGNKNLDREYLEVYISNLIKKLFNVNCKIYYKKNQKSICARLLSKGIYNYLVLVGFKDGKKEQIGIPSWISENDNLMTSFVKGLIDTDGSLMLTKKPSKISLFYPIISIKVKSKVLVEQTGKFFEKIGFKVNIIKDKLCIDKRGYKDTLISSVIISGRKNLDLWMVKINFRNKRHLDKYSYYVKSKDMGRMELSANLPKASSFESMIVEEH
ncbi:MAG: LAGLIDADG family homing endonuclease [Nanoarchaeota archaeon]